MQHGEIPLTRRCGTELTLFFTTPAPVLPSELRVGERGCIVMGCLLGKDRLIGRAEASIGAGHPSILVRTDKRNDSALKIGRKGVHRGGFVKEEKESATLVTSLIMTQVARDFMSCHLLQRHES